MKNGIFFFTMLFKPLTRRAVLRSLSGRNRAQARPESGRFLDEEVTGIFREAWEDFRSTVPDVSGYPTRGSRMNVRLASLTVSMLRTLLAHGVERKYAIDLIGDICWSIYRYWGKLGRFLTRITSHDAIKDQMKRVGKDGSWPMAFPFNPPGYLAQHVNTSDGVGFNVIHCPVAEFLRTRDASDLCESTWCMLDYPLAEMIHLRLERSQTLASGAENCDFRWYRSKGKSIEKSTEKIS